ncbi:MAG: hypothetical protein HQM10_21680 [Candidatus Riflebacteria bacterium]|nr:hypothetical protein [Candidatus Riflebacteria bacterium]
MPLALKPYLLHASLRTDIASDLSSYPFNFDDSGISEIALEDTEQYLVTRDYLNNYPRCLEQLMTDDQS